VERAFGRTFRVQLGWDTRKGAPRPFATLIKPGAVALVGQSCEPAALRAGLPVTLNGDVITGLNALVPVDEYYRLLRG